MRRNLAKLPYPVIGRATATSTSISAGFSTSSTGGGGGGGRGRGTRSPFQFTVGSSAKNESDDSKFEDAPQPPPPSHGRGRGRGQPLPPTSALPHFSSWINDPNAPPVGRGRGFVPPKTISPPPRPLQRNKDNSERSMSLVEAEKLQSDSSESEFPSRREEKLPTEISHLLAGAGRGKPAKVAEAPSEKPKVENRHVRAQQERKSPKSVPASPPREEISQEERVKRAMEILTRGDPEGGRDASEFRGGQGRGGVRGRGRGRGMGRGRFGGRGRGGGRHEESDDEVVGLSQGGPEDEEKLAKKFGPKIMNELVEVFEDISDRVLPSPIDDAYMDALHTNLLIECEPEYLMEDFGTNPDIDEKPPIPLRDALEKMKPFLMAYEGIESQEEWEEVMKETMEVTVPHMKEIVDYYSGPDRITAKQQQEELERVAKTLPPSAPDSVKRFTDRALLSLQSNPGWGFDKKCQFMDKLVMEVSQLYK